MTTVFNDYSIRIVRRGGGVILNIASHAGMIAAEAPVGRGTPFLTPAADRDHGDNQGVRDAITRKTLLKRFCQPEAAARPLGRSDSAAIDTPSIRIDERGSVGRFSLGHFASSGATRRWRARR